ncbi:hypothetical protein JCM19274_2894 [Algibacter lectus]|uniref:Uncharacterized protein n=1 Tax=Algibacter lectus TaxID=221126 RepID=A0A090WXS3_9FLAO|nr:hypothetical protein JCM19274_2894 [Algibacter lectus]
MPFKRIYNEAVYFLLAFLANFAAFFSLGVNVASFFTFFFESCDLAIT